MKHTLLILVACAFSALCGSLLAHGPITPPVIPPGPPAPPFNGPPDAVPIPQPPTQPPGSPPDSTPPPPPDVVPEPPVSVPPPAAPPTAPPTTGPGNPGLTQAAPPTGRRKKAATLESASTWDVWWRINQDRFIDLRATIRGHRPQTSHNETPVVKKSEDELLAGHARMRTHVVPFLRRGLGDDDPFVRAHAVFALGKLGSPARAKDIAPALKDTSKMVRDSALLSLGLLADGDAADVLGEIAADTKAGRAALGRIRKLDSETRVLASLALGLAGKDGNRACSSGAPVLLELLRKHHANADINVAAAMGLGVIGTRESVPALLAVLEDEEIDSYVRASAVNSLGKIGELSVLGKLMGALEDRDIQVRRSATVAVGQLARPSDIEVVDALVDVATTERDRIQRNFAIMALGRVGGGTATAALRAMVKDGDLYERTFGAIALGVDGHLRQQADPKTAKLLLSALKRTRTTEERGALVVALGLLGHQDAAPYLRTVVSQPGDAGLRAHAAVGLGLLRDTGAIPALRDVLRTKGSVTLQTSSTIALGLIGDSEATSLLESIFLEESFIGARSAALRGLGMIGHEAAALSLGRLILDNPESSGSMTRAFAAEALGVLGDKDDIPAMAALAEATNFTCSRGILERVLKAIL